MNRRKIDLAIVTATNEEMDEIISLFESKVKMTIYGYEFWLVNNNSMMLCLAVLGVSKVAFSIGIQILIDHFSMDYLLSMGYAGTLDENIKLLDVCICVSSFQYDIISSKGITIHSDELENRRKNIYHAHPKAINFIRDILNETDIHEAVIATGNNFYHGEAITTPHNINDIPLIFDQETFALYQACHYSNIKGVSIKIITDKCNKRQYEVNAERSKKTLKDISSTILRIGW